MVPSSEAKISTTVLVEANLKALKAREVMEVSEVGRVKATGSEADVAREEHVVLLSTSSNESSGYSAPADGCHKEKHPGLLYVFNSF